MRNAVCLLLCSALAGCAGHTEFTVRLSTNAPPGTLVVREGNARYLTTGYGEVRLDPARDHSLVLEAPGYKPGAITLTSHVSPLAVLSTLCVMLPIAPVGIPLFVYLASIGGLDCLEPGNPWVKLAHDDEAR